VTVSQTIRQKTLEFLTGLIRIPSTRGNEGPASRFVQAAIAGLVDSSRLVPIDDAILQDPDYAFPIPGLSYAHTPNVECVLRGGGGKSILFNTHLDVVPASEGQDLAFVPQVEGGTIKGRGACDAKGQVATLYALAWLYKERGTRPPGDLLFHFVIEEENGGNGTLAMVRRGVEAAAAVVLEPSEMYVIPAVRGAASRGLPLFDVYPDPMPLTFGQCMAGNWPASVPAEAVLKGLIGFLPNRDRHQVQAGLREALLTRGDDWLRQNFELSFPMLNNDGNSLPEDHPLVTGLLDAVRHNGETPRVRAMTAACDAWRYNNQAGIPTVVFGPGSLSVAHSKEEHIQLDDVLKAAEILYDFSMNFG
jgi:acetylornithine deacetylase